jgi:hypothetical protein
MGKKKAIKGEKPEKVSKVPLLISILCFLLPFYFLRKSPVASGNELYVFLYFFLLGIAAVCYYPLKRISTQKVSSMEKIPVTIVLLGLFGWVHYYFFFTIGVNTRILFLIVVAAIIGIIFRVYSKNVKESI